MRILGIESSCDETAAAILQDGSQLLANVINSQIEVHGKYGGVVPELASRKHMENIYPVVQKALNQAKTTLNEIDAIAVTQGPGLIGSLLVGLSYAKAISFVKKIPYVGINHMAGHLASIMFSETPVSFPLVALIASGGHSSIYHVKSLIDYDLLGRTRDDAAGEAFDKVAKVLQLDYPGGPVISNLAEKGDRSAINFPRAWLELDSLDFSFSGIKTAVANFVQKQKQNNSAVPVENLCASFQEAIVEVLTTKTINAAKNLNINTIAIAGGVAANPRLRQLMAESGNRENISVIIPPAAFCTDNAAMVAMAGHYRLPEEGSLSYDLDVYSRTI